MMSLKSFCAFLIVIGAIVFIYIKFFAEYLHVILIIGFILGIVGTYMAEMSRRDRDESPFTQYPNLFDQDNEEYHNDFSKVPAGVESGESFLEVHEDDSSDEVKKTSKKNKLDVY